MSAGASCVPVVLSAGGYCRQERHVLFPRVVERLVAVGGRGGVGCVVVVRHVCRVVFLVVCYLSAECPVCPVVAEGIVVGGERVVLSCRVLFGPVGRIVAGGCGVLSAGCPVVVLFGVVFASRCPRCRPRSLFSLCCFVFVVSRVVASVGESKTCRPPVWVQYPRWQFFPAHCHHDN